MRDVISRWESSNLLRRRRLSTFPPLHAHLSLTRFLPDECCRACGAARSACPLEPGHHWAPRATSESRVPTDTGPHVHVCCAARVFSRPDRPTTWRVVPPPP